MDENKVNNTAIQSKLESERISPEGKYGLGKRKKILWIIAIVILLLAFLLWIFRTSNLDVNNNNIDIEPPIFTAPSVNLEYKTPKVINNSPTEFSVINLAKSYIARFGSWSTDNQGANLNELLPLSTIRMKDYLKNIDLNFETEEFSGTTTKSLSAKIIDIADDSADVLVNTQKIITNDSLEEKVYYQEVEVKLIKSADSSRHSEDEVDRWLVDEVIWK